MTSKGYHHTEDAKRRIGNSNRHPRSEQTKNLLRDSANKRYEDETIRLKISNGLKEYYKNPENLKRMSDSRIKFFEDNPEFVKLLSDLAIKRYEDPEERKRTSEAKKNPSDETREKLSIAATKQFENPANRKKASDQKIGALNWGWKGGISFLPYCPKFNKPLKENVRSFFGNKCVLCGKTSEENKASLDVHHVFTEKMACCETKIEEMDIIRNRLPKNIAKFGEDKFSEEEIMYIRMMVPLCRKCHGKQRRRREQLPYEETEFRKVFVELILNKHGGKCYNSDMESAK